MFKKSILSVVIESLFMLVGCQPSQKTPEEPDIVIPKEIISVMGLDDITVIQNEYFHPLKNVIVLNEMLDNFAHLLAVTEQVNYGKLGDQFLTYSLIYGADKIIKTRKTTVKAGTINRKPVTRNQITQSQIQMASIRWLISH